jgi:hypothetical protein
MSKIQTIIQKAKSDKQFATLILKSPSKALASYKLSPVEVNEVVEKIRTLKSRGIWPADD